MHESAYQFGIPGHKYLTGGSEAPGRCATSNTTAVTTRTLCSGRPLDCLVHKTTLPEEPLHPLPQGLSLQAGSSPPGRRVVSLYLKACAATNTTQTTARRCGYRHYTRLASQFPRCRLNFIGPWCVTRLPACATPGRSLWRAPRPNVVCQDPPHPALTSSLVFCHRACPRRHPHAHLLQSFITSIIR